MAPTRKEQAAQSRERLLQAAEARFIDQGYEATTVAQILADAGMARGALYHYFPDGKVAIFAEAVERADVEFHTRIDTVAASGLDAPAMLLAGFRAFLDCCLDPAFSRLILVEGPSVLPEAWTGSTELGLLRQTLEAGVNTGHFRPLPLDVTAATLYGAVRRSGDHVVNAKNKKKAVGEALDVLAMLVDGLRAD